MKINGNPAYADFLEKLASKPELPANWSGVIYRVTTLTYADEKSILSGVGSFLHGGRWNAVHAFHAVYGSLDDAMALAEARATSDYYGIPFKITTPRLVVAVKVRLNSVLDLTAAKVRRALGLTQEKHRNEDWRKQANEGKEALTQALGRAAFASGIEGLIIPSARVPEGVNVVIFPENLREKSTLSVYEAEKLEHFRDG